MAIDFLLNNRKFPRAVRACVDQAKVHAASLPRSEHLIHALDKAENALPSPLPDNLDGAEVSRLMDTLQKRLAAAHIAVVETWFLPGDEA